MSHFTLHVDPLVEPAAACIPLAAPGGEDLVRVRVRVRVTVGDGVRVRVRVGVMARVRMRAKGRVGLESVGAVLTRTSCGIETESKSTSVPA